MACLMEQAATNIHSNHAYRYERKFQVRDLSVSEVEIHCQASSCRFLPTVSNENRLIISILILETLNAVVENIEGIANRLKTRIRWHGESFGESLQALSWS